MERKKRQPSRVNLDRNSSQSSSSTEDTKNSVAKAARPSRNHTPMASEQRTPSRGRAKGLDG